LIDGLEDPNPVHALGNCAGAGVEVPAGQVRTIVLAIGAYLDGVVTTGLEGRGYWACSDQFVSGRAMASRYYPRVITAALWLTGPAPAEPDRGTHGLSGGSGASPAGAEERR
jgi:hypothetical protein